MAPLNTMDTASSGWRNASKRAHNLAQKVRQARAALEVEIGPRGLTIGYLVPLNGKQFPIHAVSPVAAKKIMRAVNLTPDRYEDRAVIVAAVRAACGQWDAAAERAGVTALQRQSEAAHKQVAAEIARFTAR